MKPCQAVFWPDFPRGDEAVETFNRVPDLAVEFAGVFFLESVGAPSTGGDDNFYLQAAEDLDVLIPVLSQASPVADPEEGRSKIRWPVPISGNKTIRGFRGSFPV